MGNMFDQHREHRLARSWVATVSAAASNSTATATKAGAADTVHVITKVVAGFTALTTAHKLVTIQDGSTAKGYAVIASPGTPVDIERTDEGVLLVGTKGGAVSALVAAASATGALAVVTVYGYSYGAN